MNSPNGSTPNPLSPRNLLSGILVTVVGGLLLVYILQYLNLSSSEPSAPTSIPTLLLPSSTNTPTKHALVVPTNLATPISLTTCQVEGIFDSLCSTYKTELGCSKSQVLTGPITIEAFDNGYMFWIKADDQRIYDIKNSGQWSIYSNSWVASEESLFCDAARDIGYPAMGFGKLWCNDDTISSSLGVPHDRERPDDNAQRQMFEHGQVFEHTTVKLLFCLIMEQAGSCRCKRGLLCRKRLLGCPTYLLGQVY